MGQLPKFGAGGVGGAGGGLGSGGGGRSMMMSGLRESAAVSSADPMALDEDDGEGLETAEQMGAATAYDPSLTSAGEPVAEHDERSLRSQMAEGSSGIAAAPAETAEPEHDENVAEGDKYLAAAEEDEFGVPKIELYCMCQMPWNPNRFMVACDGCDEWYHDTCLGKMQEDLEKLDKFLCMWCIEKAKRMEARRKQHEADRAAKQAAKRARQSQRKREQQSALKRARTKPCKNTNCAQRARPQSKYCSEECGLEVAASLHHEREEKRIQEAVQSALAQQETSLRDWMETHPNFLSECSPSECTTRDLEVILSAMSELDVVKDRLVLAEAIVAEQVATAKATEMRKLGSTPASAASGESEHRLDCAVCGKDVPTTGYVGHLRECMHRNDEFAHSTVTQNPSLCNVLSRRTNRYCSMPKGQCSFHSPGSQIDYQFLVCGFNDCQVPALQCLKHADWREVTVKTAKLSLASLQDKLAKLEESVALAKQRIATRGMELERGMVNVIDERKRQQ